MEGSLVAYKVFTNGSVLQASEINDNLMRQSVMVFSNAAARSAAITVPLEGMLTWLEDVNRFENYNGSAWVQLVTPSGYSLIKSQAIGTSVTAVTVTGAFSSTYDAYQIVVAGGVASGNTGMKLQIGAATSNYRYSAVVGTYASTSITNASSAAASAFDYVGTGSTNKLGAFITVFDPFLTRNTHVQASYITINDGGNFVGVLNDNTSYSSFVLSTLNAGSWTGGTIYVYGLAKA